MKKIAATILLLMACTSVAQAQYINLNVGDCAAGGVNGAIFNACTSNTGTVTNIVGSVVLPVTTRTAFLGTVSVLDICPSTQTVPDWWRADACRSSAFVYTADSGVSPGCPTLWDTVPAAMNVLQSYPNFNGSNHLRLVYSTTVGTGMEYDLVGDGQTELGVFKLQILRDKTTGAGACAGCVLGASILLYEIDLIAGGATPETPMRLKTGQSNYFITYNNGAPCIPTPTLNRTWGAIKSLYR